MVNDSRNDKRDMIRVQLSRQGADGQKDLIIVPGGYGEGFLSDKMNLDLSHLVKCGGLFGEAIDLACEFKMSSLLLAGQLGKMIQLANGIMDDDSYEEVYDMEVLADCILLAGGDAELSQRIMYCDSLDEVVDVLWVTAFLQPVMAQMMRRAGRVLTDYAGSRIQIGALVFSNLYGLMGKTPGAEELIMRHRRLL